MENWLTKEFFTSHLFLWKITFGLAFLLILLFFGDFLASIIDILQQTKKGFLRYLFSTIFLCILFFVLRMLNGAYEMFANL
jgi:hypothetical protein